MLWTIVILRLAVSSKKVAAGVYKDSLRRSVKEILNHDGCHTKYPLSHTWFTDARRAAMFRVTKWNRVQMSTATFYGSSLTCNERDICNDIVESNVKAQGSCS